MGSGAWTGSGGSSYQGRGSGAWTGNGSEEPEEWSEGNEVADFRGVRGYRSGEENAAPQFLVDADDIYDDDYGESRLVAPPVIGEVPPSYRGY